MDAVAAGLVWYFEHGIKGGDIHDFGDAAFFSTVQLLTVSSQIKNPLTTGGRVVDVSRGAAQTLGITGKGVAKVKIDVVEHADASK